MRWRDTVSLLRERNFGWYFASRFTDTLATFMASVALAFAVLEITDSASALGLVLAARSVPMVVLMLVGGILADRLPRGLVLQTSNLTAAASQAVLAALVITGAAQLPAVVALAAVNGVADAISFPAQAGMVPQLVDRNRLQPANALVSVSRGMLAVVAPAFSAVLVVAVGPGWALAVTALAWLLSALLLLPMRMPSPPRATQSTWVDLREGWTLFRGTTWLWVVVLSFSALNAIQGGFYTLGPVVAKGTIGEQGWGLLLSATSVGVLVSSFVLLRVRLPRPLLTGMLACSLFGVPMVLLGVEVDLPLLLAAGILAGAGIEVFGIAWNLAMQEHIEERLLSRAYSYDALGSFVAIPIGQLVAGPLGDLFGARDVLVWSGLLYALVALVTVASRSVRTLERAPSA